MKKLVFYAAALIALGLLIHIVNILVNDLDRLTRYGYGFLTGKLILFIVFLAIAILTRKTIRTKK